MQKYFDRALRFVFWFIGFRLGAVFFFLIIEENTFVFTEIVFTDNDPGFVVIFTFFLRSVRRSSQERDVIDESGETEISLACFRLRLLRRKRYGDASFVLSFRSRSFYPQR